LWDVTTHRPLGQPITLETPAYSLAFSPDTVSGAGYQSNASGYVLALGHDDGTITFWDVITGQPLGKPLTGHSAGVKSLAFSPDGELLASGGWDNTVILWDVASRRPIGQPLTDHTGGVYSVAFSPSGHMLASGSRDATVILWDVATRRPLGDPLACQSTVDSVAFSPSGGMLASSCSSEGIIALWDVSPDSWQERACGLANRNLSLEEWKRYLEDEPYQATCPDAALPSPEAEAVMSDPTPTRSLMPDAMEFPDLPGVAAAAIHEDFNSGQGFIQTSPDVYITDGQVTWNYKRGGGKQYVHRSIPPFRGDVRLLVRGQVDSATNNCGIGAGIGDGIGSGVSVGFGWFGGGCPKNGPLVSAMGVSLDNREEAACEYVGNWLWVEASTPYTAELTILDDTATLSVEGIGSSTGTVNYKGPYTTLWVGNSGGGDWPECSGAIHSVTVEPLD
jgi:hypothetical protein